jgi:hypothetical protein
MSMFWRSLVGTWGLTNTELYDDGFTATVDECHNPSLKSLVSGSVGFINYLINYLLPLCRGIYPYTFTTPSLSHGLGAGRELIGDDVYNYLERSYSIICPLIRLITKMACLHRWSERVAFLSEVWSVLSQKLNFSFTNLVASTPSFQYWKLYGL